MKITRAVCYTSHNIIHGLSKLFGFDCRRTALYSPGFVNNRDILYQGKIQERTHETAVERQEVALLIRKFESYNVRPSIPLSPMLGTAQQTLSDKAVTTLFTLLSE